MPDNDPKILATKPESKRLTLDRIALIVGATLILLIFVFQWTQSVKTEPITTIPPLKTPSPNAYEFYLKAQESMEKASEIDSAFWQIRRPKASIAVPWRVQAEKIVIQHEKSLGLLRQGMQYDFLEPPPDKYLSATSVRLPLNAMVQLIGLDAFVKSSKQDWQGVVSAELDRLQFRKSIANYDLSSAAIIGDNGGSILILSAEDPIDSLTEAQCKEDIARVQTILANQRSIEELLEANKWRTLVEMDAVGNELSQTNFEAGEMRKTWFGEFRSEDIITLKSQNRRERMQSYLRDMDAAIVAIKQNQLGAVINNSFRAVGMGGMFLIDPQSVIQNRIHFQTENLRLLCKLAFHAYKLKHGFNPTSLKSLVPEYLSALPNDPASPTKKVQDRQFRDLFLPSPNPPAR